MGGGAVNAYVVVVMVAALDVFMQIRPLILLGCLGC